MTGCQMAYNGPPLLSVSVSLKIDFQYYQMLYVAITYTVITQATA